MRNIDHLDIRAYEYNGYLGIVNSIHSYFHHSMSLLNPQVWNELFYKPGLIYTKIKDEPPSKYLEHANVRNCLIANGCIIDGTVENSILFRAVKVKKGVHLKNCIVLQNCDIRENVSIENAILDKDVIVKTGRELKGDTTVPFIAAKKKII
jgi:glucose-1-phosphate adenylyltransferase